MKIFKTIPLDGDKLSAEHLANLGEGESITVHCDTVSERDNSRQNAYYVRKNIPRPDGRTYKVETSNVAQTVTVSLKNP